MQERRGRMCASASRNCMHRNEMGVTAALPMALSFPFVFQSSGEMGAACVAFFLSEPGKAPRGSCYFAQLKLPFPLSALFSRIDAIAHFHFEILGPGVSLLLL